MPKVTDPALLAQLEGSGGPVSDPSILAQLDPPQEPSTLRKIAGAVAPGIFGLFKGTPENLAERQAYAVLHDPSKSLQEKAEAFQQTPIAALTFAPTGSAPAGQVGTRGPGFLARYLDRKAVEQGRKALSGIGTPLAARKEVPEAAVRAALDSGAIKPMGTVTGTAERLQGTADDLGTQYAQILQSLEAKGVHGPEAESLARELSARASDAAANSLNSSRPGMLQATADELRSKPLPIGPGGGRLGLMQAEKMKRGLQDEARREYDKITRQTTTTGETKKELAALVRQGIEDAVQQQAPLAPAEAAAFEPVKERLSNVLGALRVAEEGAARAARRKPVSLTSTIVGGAAGASSGPAAGLAAALAHGFMDRRLASTLASGANAGAKWLRQPNYRAPESMYAVPGEALDPTIQALLRAMRARVASVAAEEDAP